MDDVLPKNYSAQLKSIDDDDQISQSHRTQANLRSSGNTNPLQDGNHRVTILKLAKLNLIVINAYLPPRGKYTNAVDTQGVDLLHEICTKYEGHNIILAGDLIIDINKKHDSCSKYLQYFLTNHTLRKPIKICEPTFHQHSRNSNSKIDYILINDRPWQNIGKAEYKILKQDHLNTSSHQALGEVSSWVIKY